MTQFGIAVTWLVLSPIAVITNIIAIVVVCHYKGQFHGTDVAFISLFVSMVMHALLVLPVPAGLVIHDEGWMYSELCSFYVWLVLCVRMSELLVTVIMNIHWMCILRFTSGQEVYSSATVVKILIVLAWFAAVVTGIVPVSGASFYTYYEETSVRKLAGGGGVNSTGVLSTVVRGECKFLPNGLGLSFVLFFVLVTLTAFIISLVASSDTLLVFHYMRKTAVNKYKASRFYLPSSSLMNASVNSAAATPSPRTVPLSYPDNGDRNGSHQSSERDGDSPRNNGGVSVHGYNGAIPSNHSQGHGSGAFTQASPEMYQVEETGQGYDSVPRNGSSYSHNVHAGGGASSAAAVVVRPSVKSGVAKSNPPTVHARYNELNLSSELCRVVLCYTVLSALLCHLPFVTLQFVQLVQAVDRDTAETTILWLTLVHSLLVPHVLWALSRRYRHALSYTWTVHVLRDESAKEEDPSACTLQSYTRKVRTPDGNTVRVMAKARGRAPVTLATYEKAVTTEQMNGNAVLIHDDAPNSPTADRGAAEATSTTTNGARGTAEVITTDLDDGMTVITNLASQQVTYIYDTPPERSPERLVGRESSENSGRSSQATVSPSRSSLGTPTRGSTDIKRSSSARQVWKEQMRKKHLPAIFINEAFESDELEGEEQRPEAGEPHTLPDVTRVSDSDVTQVQGSHVDDAKVADPQFHYYMSGNFHYDNLRSDSLQRIESESEGGSFQYDDNDIEGILDRDPSTRSARKAPHMGTFLGNPRDLSFELKQQSLPPASRSYLTHSDSDEQAAAFAPQSSSSLKKSRKESAEAVTRAGNRKPPRRSGMLKQTSRPSLQYQRSLHADPESESDLSTSVEEHHHHTEETKLEPEQSFYPTFEEVDSSSKVVPTTDLDEKSDEDADESTLLCFDADETLEARTALPVSNAVNESVNLVDTSDIFVTIDNVTKDATHTDDVVTQDKSGQPLLHSMGSGQSSDSFHPLTEATVLGILLEDGTEIPAYPPPSYDEVKGASDLDHSAYFSEGQADRFNPFAENDTNRSFSLTNPFLEDLKTETNSAIPPHGDGLAAQEQKQSNKMESQGNNTSAVDSHHDIAQAADLVVAEATRDKDKEEMITRVDSDVPPPDTAVVLDIEETGSINSDPSVVLEPYHEDRRPPWMDEDSEDDSPPKTVKRKSRNPFRPSFDAGEDDDAFGSSGDFGSSFGSNAELGTIFGNRSPSVRPDFNNPFAFDCFNGNPVDESDSDFLQSSGGSEQLNGLVNGVSDQYQSYPMFDEETDRGFEDALALEYVIGRNPYFGNIGRTFESIEEEPEDLTDSINSTDNDKQFKTTRISRPSSRSGNIESSEPNTPTKMNGKLSSQNSELSVGSTSGNPFAIEYASSEPLADSNEVLLEQFPTSFDDTPVVNGQGPEPNGNKPEEDAEPEDSPAARVRLTKPIRWTGSVNASESGFNSHFADLDDPWKEENVETSGQDAFPKLNHIGSSTVNTTSSEMKAKVNKPPVPFRPVRRVTSVDESVANKDPDEANRVDPVYF